MLTFILAIGVAAPAMSASWTQTTWSGRLIKPLLQTGTNPLQSWDASITASFASGSDDAFFGVRPDATDGFDVAYDSPEPPAPPAKPYVQAYFYYEANPEDYTELDKSIIGPSSTLVWDNLEIHYAASSGSTTMTLSWDISDIPTSYSVCLYEAGESGSLVADMRAVSSYSYTAPHYSIAEFKIVVSRPALISPGNESTVSLTPTFEWTSVSDPSGITYQIQINDDDDFSSPVYDQAGLTSTTFTLPGESALAPGMYFWHIQARNGTSQFRGLSDTWNFTALPVGAIGAILMPLLMLLPLVLMLRRQNRRYH